MANQLNMAEIGAILTLHKSEHSNRAIADLLARIIHEFSGRGADHRAMA